jgi:hypothetical protein
MKISDFLTALATDPVLQAAFEADPRQAALDFGLSVGEAEALARAASSGNLDEISNMLRNAVGGGATIFMWIKRF